MPQEKPKKKKPLSNTPSGLGAKLGSAVRESFPLAKSPAALGAALGAKMKGYMDSKKKKDSSKYIKYLDDSDKKKELKHFKKHGSPKGYHIVKGSRG
jgi:hypothetical protein